MMTAALPGVADNLSYVNRSSTPAPVRHPGCPGSPKLPLLNEAANRSAIAQRSCHLNVLRLRLPGFVAAGEFARMLEGCGKDREILYP
jgi:hypothetical protein